MPCESAFSSFLLFWHSLLHTDQASSGFFNIHLPAQIKLSLEFSGESIQYYHCWCPLLIDIIFTALIGRQLPLSKQKWLVSVCMCALWSLSNISVSVITQIGSILCAATVTWMLFLLLPLLIIVPNQSESNAERKVFRGQFGRLFPVNIYFTLCCK